LVIIGMLSFPPFKKAKRRMVRPAKIRATSKCKAMNR